MNADAANASIEIVPNYRFKPICHRCGHQADVAHSWAKRRIRDLNLATATVWLNCHYRKLFCPVCQGISVEDLELFEPYIRVTRRLANYVYQLCKVMTVTDVASHLNLDWKTVKNIDKKFLEKRYANSDLNNLQIIAVDEIAVRRGHNYLTVVLDYLSGRVLFVGKDRTADTLKVFFNQMTPKQRQSIKAVAMDMWDPFIKAVKKNCQMPRSYSTCSMLLPLMANALIRYEISSTATRPRKIKPFLKEHGICC